MQAREEQYRINIAADHGMDGYIVETTKGFHHLKHQDEIDFIKELFKGEKTICAFYDDYIKKSTKMYGSHYGQAIDLVRDKPLYKLLMELSANIEKRMHATVKVIRYESRYINSIHNHLTRVDAANNEVEYEERISMLLQHANYESHLNLLYYGLGNKAAKAINELLLAAEKMPGLKRANAHFFRQASYPIRGIDLTKNFITSLGCEALFSGLSVSNSLKYLSLRQNPIGDEGLIWITRALSNPSFIVKELNVIDCDLTDACMHHLALFVINNKELDYIRLSGNTITDKGIEIILESVKSNPSIKEINLYRTKVTDHMKERLETILADKNSASFKPSGL